MDKPSATLLVVADYSTGATASVTKTSLSMLVREGMGWGPIMGKLGGLGPVESFKDILDGAGVATLLMRDRDGQLKVRKPSPMHWKHCIDCHVLIQWVEYAQPKRKTGIGARPPAAGRDAGGGGGGGAGERRLPLQAHRLQGRGQGHGLYGQDARQPRAHPGGAARRGAGESSTTCSLLTQSDFLDQSQNLTHSFTHRLTSTQRIRQASDVPTVLQDASPIEIRPNAATPAQSSSRAVAPSTLVRQQADLRVSKAKAFLRDDGTILTVWVSANRSAWKDPDSGASLQAILASFDLAPR